MKGLADLSQHLRMPAEPEGRDNNFMMFGLLVLDESKDELVQFLEANGIETRDIPSLLNQPIYEHMFGHLENKLPVARSITRSGFCIGYHESLGTAEIEHVIETFHRFFKK